MRTAMVIGIGALVVLCARRRHDLSAAIGGVPPQALGALAAVLAYAGALAVAAQVARSRTPGASRTRCR
jgi:hypothetical protein